MPSTAAAVGYTWPLASKCTNLQLLMTLATFKGPVATMAMAPIPDDTTVEYLLLLPKVPTDSGGLA